MCARKLVGDLAFDRHRPEHPAEAARERQAIGNHVVPMSFATALVK